MDYTINKLNIPIFINLKNKPILIIGNGNVIIRKINLLIKFNPKIYIISNILCNNFLNLIKNKKIILLSNKFNNIFLKKKFIFVIIKKNILKKKTLLNIKNKFNLINIIDDKKNCSFFFPSIIYRNPLIISISSNGKIPLLTRLIKEKLESLIPENFKLISKISNNIRKKINKYIKILYKRKKIWEWIFESSFLNYISNKKYKLALKILKYKIKKKNNGEIILVGSGPGNINMLTISALKTLQKADIILYDYLINKNILKLVRLDSIKICINKKRKKNKEIQKKINKLLLYYSKKGKCVVRLKGGDPFIFARGVEEIKNIYKSGISFKIIPGISSGIGISSYTGIPLTYRNYSYSLLIITGKTVLNKINWSSAVYSNQTIIIYMGLYKIKKIIKKIIYYGKSINTPIAIISKGTYKKQKILISKLFNFKKILKKKLFFPIIVIIGKVINLNKRFFFNKKF